MSKPAVEHRSTAHYANRAYRQDAGGPAEYLDDATYST